MIRILNLDLGHTTGWATRTAQGIESGAESFKPRRGESAGMTYVKFRAWLYRMVQAFDTELIAYEMPLHMGGGSTEVLFGLATRIHEIVADLREAGRKIDYVQQNQGCIKKHVTGFGDAKKEEVTRWAALKLAIPLESVDNNRGDAVALCSLTDSLYNGVAEPVQIDGVQRSARAKPGESTSRWAGRKGKKGKKPTPSGGEPSEIEMLMRARKAA